MLTIYCFATQDFDKSVERTKNRPIASGEIDVQHAMVFLGANLAAGLSVLVQLNLECWQLG
jgi:4-hydroxybenzoate polyprenyltransferase